MKAGYDARIRAKAEREVDKARLAEETRIDEERRRDDMAGWLREVRREHEVRFYFLPCQFCLHPENKRS